MEMKIKAPIKGFSSYSAKKTIKKDLSYSNLAILLSKNDRTSLMAACECLSGELNSKITSSVEVLRCLLIFVVREEMEVLKRKIERLTIKESLLIREYAILRGLLPPEMSLSLAHQSRNSTFDVAVPRPRFQKWK
ncbi:hypothetical protein SK128_015405 [Halocaridina rubra]|uniref:Uncharacterized protein n=1 Tax=Halocaridina rubra TaxID=373956 RepID=A0AAN8XDH1_HALRR